DWLRVKGLPHPRTWVYSSRQQALDFADLCSLPIVFKSPFGAAAAGVRVLKTRRALKRMVRRVFDHGFVPSGSHRRDRQWGRVLLQEYLPDVREWRMVRIGDSFMCRLKERVGEYHSGSGLVAWARPPVRVLDFARHVTDIGGFRSMDVDIFETVEGLLLVNELQAVFGGIRDSNMDRGVEHRGRWRWNPSEPAWQFEAGDFYRNACANERIRYILEESPRPPGMPHSRAVAQASAEGEEVG
ncbi:MAG: hypothetical protein MUE60_08040, partial [Candidatus Eisenbacteria bacterium]|nr:hypothetical protein [Candidatus Eisenbacteria bacterium]